jgi:hypothetical protein
MRRGHVAGVPPPAESTMRRNLMATAQMGETRYEVEHPMSPSETPLATEVSETERRIISVWKAERHEREAYWRNIV